MKSVNGYLSDDGTFFAQEEACLQHERQRLRFYALSQRVDILLQPSTTGQEPDVKPDIKSLLEPAGAWDYDSALCSFLMHIRQLLNDNDSHDQLESLIGVLTYLVGE